MTIRDSNQLTHQEPHPLHTLQESSPMNFRIAAPLIIAIAITQTGCATNYANKKPEEVAANITVKNSEFDSSITYIGPQAFSETRRGLFVDNETVALAASQDKKTKEVKYAIYARILYTSEWRLYKSASFRDGTTTDIKQISQQVNTCTGVGCIHTEEVGIPVELNRLTTGGDLEFRLNSNSGAENIIKLPQSYIMGFIQSVHERITDNQ